MAKTYNRATVPERQKISAENLRYYQRGYKDGENQLKQTCKLLKTVNHNLFDELIRLDKEDPVSGVMIPFEEARHLLEVLRKPKENRYQADKLKKHIKNAEEKATNYFLTNLIRSIKS